MKLWVDDERPAPNERWYRTNTAEEALKLLLMSKSGMLPHGGWKTIEELSVDHDLGDGQPTGYDLLYCMARLQLTVPVIRVHSMNPEGRAAMLNLIEQFELAR